MRPLTTAYSRLWFAHAVRLELAVAARSDLRLGVTRAHGDLAITRVLDRGRLPHVFGFYSSGTQEKGFPCWFAGSYESRPKRDCDIYRARSRLRKTSNAGCLPSRRETARTRLMSIGPCLVTYSKGSTGPLPIASGGAQNWT